MNKNKNLHLEFVRLGRERHKITYKLLALLPKIYAGEIYREQGFSSIFEYAYKLAGLSESLVKKSLRLADDLMGKPYLQRAVETQGVHKVALVAKIATAETDSFFADKVENMSKSALNILSKEMRGKTAEEPMRVELDREMQVLFFKLKKEVGKDLSNKEFLRRVLKMMAKKANPQEQAKKSADFPGKISRGRSSERPANQPKKISRHIPVAIRRMAIEKTDGKCAHENCNQAFDVLHHVGRFALKRDHSNVVPLCKEHHEFAHNGLLEGDGNEEIDRLFRKYRHAAVP